MTYWKATVSTIVVAALTAAAPLGAFAQSDRSNEDVTTKQSAEAGAEPETEGRAETASEGSSTQNETEMPEGDSIAEESMTDEEATAEAGAESSKAVEGTILPQDENTVLAADLIGLPVYNMSDETIGDINDMIVTFDGKVQGLVIGVGGFLGIGEKDVDVELASPEIKETEATCRACIWTPRRTS